ncbi:MAG: 8-amino-7-oxononanoate synthase [Bacteroidota bacterium]
MKEIPSQLTHKLNTRKSENGLRALTISDLSVDFASNDYLGLARSEKLASLIAENFLKVKHQHLNGSTGSRLLTGNTSFAEAVEQRLAKFFQSESALLFNSGYTANLAVLSAIPQRGDTIIYDELSHACIKDGARLSMANRFAFRHNDLEDLKLKLGKATGDIYIVVESIYSMDGDESPLKEIVDLAGLYNAYIIIDEAHSTGVCGNYGEGFCIAQGVAEDIFIRIHTFGKGMGIHGACVVGDTQVKDYLINFARSFIYTTALDPHSLVAIDAAFSFLKTNTYLIDDLNKAIDLFVSTYYGHTEAGMMLRTASNSAIQGLIIPGNERVKAVANRLAEQGYDARPILSPTVKPGQERLRICLHAYNTKSEIEGLIQSLVEIIE